MVWEVDDAAAVEKAAVCGPTRTLLDMSVLVPVTVTEVWALNSPADVAVLYQRVVVKADDFRDLLGSSSLYHVLGVPVIPA